MKNALNNQVGMLGDTFLWLVANLKQGVIYFIKQTCGNEIMPSVYTKVCTGVHSIAKNVIEMQVTYPKVYAGIFASFWTPMQVGGLWPIQKT
jgi:hypothetical protein